MKSRSLYGDKSQRGYVTIFFSAGSNPLTLWETHVKDGFITRSLDPELKTMIMDLRGVNVSTTYMICPKGKQELGIYLPFLVMIIKNLHQYFTFEITVRDDSGFKRRFRIANFQSCTKIDIYNTSMPIGLADGWNQVQFNLADFTRRAYDKQYVEVVKVKINANIRLRRIYFAERLVPEEELPPAYRLFYPLQKKKLEQMPAEKQEEVKADILPEQSIEPSVRSGEKRQSQDEDKKDLRRASQMSSGGTKRESKDQGSLKPVPEVVETAPESSEKPTEKESVTNIKEPEGEETEKTPSKMDVVESETKDEAPENKTSQTTPPGQSSEDKDAGDVANREDEAVEVIEDVPESENMTVEDKVPESENMTVEDKVPESENITVEDKVPESENITVEDKVPESENMTVEDKVPESENMTVEDKDVIVKGEVVN